MSRFLMIQNPGVASLESFTLLGASNKAGTDAIGQFGSGTKFAVLAMMRAGLYPSVHCGTLHVQFGTKGIAFDGAEHQQVCVVLKGKQDGKKVGRTEELSLVLRYGEIDWKDIRLAAREFVSNALDAVSGDASQVQIEIVDAPRARDGFTRVYLPLDDEGKLEDFANNIGDWFLHFTDKVWRNTAILDKGCTSKARIYRRGVFVRTVENGADSIFDYNLNDLQLDEARTADDWSVRYEAAKVVRTSKDPKYVASILANCNSLEAGFDLAGAYEYPTAKEMAARQEVWAKAQEMAFGDDAVIIGRDADSSMVEGKGYIAVRVPEEVHAAAIKFGARTPVSILTADEREGRRVDEVCDTSIGMAVGIVWHKLVSLDATRGEKFPGVKSYAEEMKAGRRTLGLWKDGTVYINKCLASGEKISEELFTTILEELAHHITKATDNSRDFQEYFLKVLTKLLMTK